MTLSDCYRLLELEVGASYEDVKTSYRRLVRRYHPDVNPSDEAWAKDKFIELTHAYEFLLKVLSSSKAPSKQHQPDPNLVWRKSVKKSPRRSVQTTSRSSSNDGPIPVEIRSNPALSDIDNELKKTSYQQLQEFLKDKRFARAIALVEGLASRITNDPEVKQWQAIAYRQYGRHFADELQPAKAKIYLRKALKVDPNNRKLWMAIQRDLERLNKRNVNP